MTETPTPAPAPTARIAHIFRHFRIVLAVTNGRVIRTASGQYRPDRIELKYDVVGSGAWVLRCAQLSGPKIDKSGDVKAGQHAETIYTPTNLPDWVVALDTAVRPSGGLGARHVPDIILTSALEMEITS